MEKEVTRFEDLEDANEICSAFYRRGTLDRVNIYITGFLIATDEADQEISHLLAEMENQGTK